MRFSCPVVSLSLVCVLFVCQSVKAGGREWVSSALEPQIVHLRPPVDEDKRVLQPPRNEEAKQ
jgi:hypothetical protein